MLERFLTRNWKLRWLYLWREHRIPAKRWQAHEKSCKTDSCGEAAPPPLAAPSRPPPTFLQRATLTIQGKFNNQICAKEYICGPDTCKILVDMTPRAFFQLFVLPYIGTKAAVQCWFYSCLEWWLELCEYSSVVMHIFSRFTSSPW